MTDKLGGNLVLYEIYLKKKNNGIFNIYSRLKIFKRIVEQSQLILFTKPNIHVILLKSKTRLSFGFC